MLTTDCTSTCAFVRGNRYNRYVSRSSRLPLSIPSPPLHLASLFDEVGFCLEVTGLTDGHATS